MSNQVRTDMDPSQPAPTARLIALFLAMRSRAASAGIRKYTFIGAISILGVGLYVSIRALPPDLGVVRPRLLLLTATVGVPLAVVLTVVETSLSARMVDVRFGWLLSLRVSILSSAANMLPLPGGPLVRVSALTGAGGSLGASSAATGLVAVTWLGLACIFAAFGAGATSHALAAGFAMLGICLGAVAAAALYYLCRSWRLLCSVLLIKSAAVIIDLLRMTWALGALGVETSVREISVFAISGVAGAAVSVIPAGLGINEAAAAVVAPLSDIASSAAFLATALNRVAALAIILPLALLFSAGAWRRGSWRNQDTPPG